MHVGHARHFDGLVSLSESFKLQKKPTGGHFTHFVMVVTPLPELYIGRTLYRPTYVWMVLSGHLWFLTELVPRFLFTLFATDCQQTW